MHPFIQVFSAQIPSYGLMMFLGAVFGALLALLRCPGKGFPRSDTLYAFLFGAVGLIVGAKLLYLIVSAGEIWEARQQFIAAPAEFLNALMGGGFVFYGGLIGGILAVFIYCRLFKIDFLRICDLFAPTIALMHALGRVGCFLAGCCYGIHTGSAFDIAFRHSLSAPNGVPLFPVQLLESGLNLLLVFVLLLFSIKNSLREKPGGVIGLYLSWYALARFALEFLRADSARGGILGVSTSQIISLVLLPVGLYLLLRKKRIKACLESLRE